MGIVFQVVLFVLTGTLLLWFGYTLFFDLGTPGRAGPTRTRRKAVLPEGIPGAPRVCPVCSAKLASGERVKSSAFPSMGGTDRLMHISGCVYCLSGERRRTCPVCGKNLAPDEYLIARLFDKPGRSHVHVLGCTRCRGPRSQRT